MLCTEYKKEILRGNLSFLLNLIILFSKPTIMKKIILLFFFFAHSILIFAQNKTTDFVKENYIKMEFMVPMRDSVKLFTSIYVPKNASSSNTYPFLMQRTCYDVSPYGIDNYSKKLYYSSSMMYEKFIFVNQDVRGRYMSEGEFTNMTPHLPNKKGKKETDEASDTYDTIEWLLKNVSFNNGRVGIYGISYPGFYAVAGALCGHPALKASSPQAPVSDFYFDDFHHNGAFMIGYGMTFPVFGVQHPKPTDKDWFNDDYPKHNTKDGFEWYKSQSPLSKLGKNYEKNFFWKEHVDHPNYDEFWQKRSILPHLKNVKNLPAMMIVGGWFDAEDLSGPLNIYKTLEKNNAGAYNTIVMGPFGHGDWSRDNAQTMHSNIYFGDSVAHYFQKNIELKFFKHFLKGSGDKNSKLAEATLFDTGKKEWKNFEEWPVKNSEKVTFYLRNDGKLSKQDLNDNGFSEFVSDPNKPVPYTENNTQINGFTPRAYMSEDQRFAGRRTDFLVYETDTLSSDMTMGGEIMAKLNIATNKTDADWFVKLIDVYPGNEQNSIHTPANVVLGGYQQMVRSEIMRSRFRNSFEKPEPLVSNQKTAVNFRLQDVLHTFKKGHKIMIQVQSTAFPLFDINPQKYVENIYKAEEGDFEKATHKVFSDSVIEVEVLK
jgi:uncharacterized protein